MSDIQQQKNVHSKTSPTVCDGVKQFPCQAPEISLFVFWNITKSEIDLNFKDVVTKNILYHSNHARISRWTIIKSSVVLWQLRQK